MILEGRNIHKSFGQVEVLKGVDISVETGEVMAIVGKSGAGKSTLLHILGTLSPMDQGEVTINGIKVNQLKEKKLAEFRNQEIGFIFQFHHLLPEFNALENVCIPGFIAGENKTAIEDKAKELLAYLELDDRLDHKPSQLSGGEQQRVAVARSLINNPSIVLADEPTGNLDTNTSGQLHELLFRIRKDFNTAFVIVTHNRDLSSISDRVVELVDGVIVS